MQREGLGSLLREGLKVFGSPLNLIHTDPFVRNIEALLKTGRTRNLDLAVFFARKANKCLSFVDACRINGYGVDVASEVELRQTLARGVLGSGIACTAAVKSRSLLETCLQNDVCVVMDNSDELELAASVAKGRSRSLRVALRLAGFEFEGRALESRFGFPLREVPELLRRPEWRSLALEGLHFHLDGYCPKQRIAALAQCLDLYDSLETAMDRRIAFIDCGGGVPMSYLESERQWNDFWKAHEDALLGRGDPVTFGNNGYGRIVVDGHLHGQVKRYPFYQSLVQDQWLERILDAPCQGATIAEALAKRGLQLRLEPGRSVLDGSGVTAAEVAFRKRHSNGQPLVGLAMNHTQCRTSSVDFFADPLLYRSGGETGQVSLSGDDSAFLVGAYCTESEFLSLRRFHFPEGVAVGDIVVFPNTAGYFMHFRESRSHQFPLAKNIDITQGTLRVDACERS
ncbi:hypothetical protein [Pelagicoccus sp. SDUM812005]|uniref:hypothetical protein n=1 Tax=Pelagicoccus sp. SDUM812005 TaxID=3041257 RepID=UPI00280D8BB9|nr:hypothetical protein [Pelagicoccus sp. SDUM812005]MDQ8181045.1 hypothetical protein [Pelagicoccus sp. SDUM812005]